MTDPEPIATWALGRHVGRVVRVYETLDSTNTFALAAAADPANAGLAIVARSQTAGRGQYGRTWSAPAGASVLLSVLVHPPPELRPPAILTAWAAVAVCEVIDALDRSPPAKPGGEGANTASIKWPNDVLVAGKKIAGILIEQRTVAGSLAAVVGIGLNVRQSVADFAELPEATSLRTAKDRLLETEAVGRSLIERLDADYAKLLEGDVASLAERWQHRLGLVGQPVVVECVDRTVRGHLIEVGLAEVVLRIDDEPVSLRPESIRQLRLDDMYKHTDTGGVDQVQDGNSYN